MSIITQQAYAELYAAAAKLKGIKLMTPDERLKHSIFGGYLTQLEAEQAFKKELHSEMKQMGIESIVDSEGNSYNL